MEKSQLKDKSVDDLWEKFAATRDGEVKNQLLLEYISLVKKIVFRMLPKYEAYNDFDDLLSCGVIGLMDAIDRYEPGRGIKFESYAGKRIYGEIIDQMRRQDWAPASLRRKIKKVSQGYEDLEMSLGRTVNEQEVAAHLGMDEQELLKVLDQSHMFNLIRFEELLGKGTVPPGLMAAQDDEPLSYVTHKETVQGLEAVINTLGEKEKIVVSLYYYEGFTLKQIANVLGVTESRVSQIHSKLLLKLRQKMEKKLSLNFEGVD